jgi:hypothetical protein
LTDSPDSSHCDWAVIGPWDLNPGLYEEAKKLLHLYRRPEFNFFSTDILFAA